MPFLKSDSFTNNKPISLSIKDWIIRKMAPSLLLSEKTIEAVVNHQFQSAHEALLNNNSLEISGFGKFVFNEKKAIKQMQKFESQKALFSKIANDESLSEQKRHNARKKLETAEENIKALKPKMYAFTDLRGMEEQSASSQEAEGGNQ
jgi:nucleoid DNA-binding protein